MSDLQNILRESREPICSALAGRLCRSGCAMLVRAQQGEAGALFDALVEVRGDAGRQAADTWAEGLFRESQSLGLEAAEVFAGLHALQRSVGLHLFKSPGSRELQAGAVLKLSEAVEQMRQAYLAVILHDRERDQLASDFAAFADQSSDFICLATTRGKPVYLNQAARQMMGLTPDAPAHDARLQDFYCEPSWAELCNIAVPAVNATGRWEGKSRLRGSAGAQASDVLTILSLVKHVGPGKANCLAIVHRPLGHEAELETALAETEARKRAILESSLDPIITIDHEGVIIEFNRAAEQTFGHPRDKILGTRPSDVLFPPSQLPGQQDRVDRYLQLGEGSMLGKRAEVAAVRASGEVFPAEMAMTMNQQQGALVLTFFIRDISLRKKAEAAQARYAAELERSNEELQQFAYVASHDLQEPLRKILAFGERLAAGYTEKLDDAGRGYIERMRNAAQRMQALIDGLLTLSRVTTHSGQFEPVDLGKVVSAVVSDLETQIERVQGRVEIENLPTIQADFLQMRQLFQNLIGNALKFHRPDEPPVVRVAGRLFPERGRRGEHTAGHDEQCRILVEDNGIGFDEKYRERIFAAFQRLHPRDVYEGTGIGLAICQKIVSRHGGTISASSIVGQGSTFEIVLPVRARARTAGSP